MVVSVVDTLMLPVVVCAVVLDSVVVGESRPQVPFEMFLSYFKPVPFRFRLSYMSFIILLISIK